MHLEPGHVYLDTVRGLMAHASDLIDPNEAAYLFATGKSELEVRNALALHINREANDGYVAIREWKRHDLAVLDSQGDPFLIIEGKSWVHSDAIKPAKLKKGDTSIRAGLEGDLAKLVEARRKFPQAQTYITTLLFSIEFSDESTHAPIHKAVKYASLHKQGVKASGDLEKLMDSGRSAMLDFFGNYGTSMWLPLWTGEFRGLTVKSEIIILEPDFAKVEKILGIKPKKSKKKKKN
jgi:hypothetical protein